MHIVSEEITVKELKKMSEKMFGGLVKAVVDVQRAVMVIDAELHADEELLLLEAGSNQEDLWGINIYPDKAKENDWIVFDSMINLRPSWGNRNRGVDDPKVQERIRSIVNRLVVL